MRITTTVVALATTISLLFSSSLLTTVQSTPRITNQEYIERKTENLLLVRQVGEEVGHAETLQAILLQETNGGTSSLVGNPAAPLRNRSYGLMQVQITAARSMLRRYPELADRYFPDRKASTLSDKEIADFLVANHEGNVRIAAHHFRLYFNMVGGDWARAVAAYNVGIGGVKKIQQPEAFGYVREIKHKLHKIVQPFNRKHTVETPSE